MNSDYVASPSERADRPKVRRILLVPLMIFAGLTIIFAWGLTRNPRDLPSTLLGKHVPQFSLSPVKGRTLGLASDNLVGEVSLVNVFASWCVECRLEHPLLMQLKSQGVVTIHGLNYKDRPDDAARWLDEQGDPYTRTGADTKGRVGIDWGVYGVPETFVIGKDGRIAYKQIGPLSVAVLEKTIIPLIETLNQKPSRARQDVSGANNPTERHER